MTECLATERLNPAVLVNGLVEELERERRYIEHSERLEYGDVQQSVVQGGLWGNIRIVSILRCVSAGYQERLVSQGAAVHFQFIGFRTVLQAFEQSLFQISEWSSPSRLGELQAYKCVESHAAGAEERHIVDFSVVNDVYQSVIDDVDGLFGSIGICRWRASPLPELQGMMPKAVFVCTSERAISLMEPSPLWR